MVAPSRQCAGTAAMKSRSASAWAKPTLAPRKGGGDAWDPFGASPPADSIEEEMKQ